MIVICSNGGTSPTPDTFLSSTRLVVQHWLNGRNVLEYECGSPEIMNRVSKTKFKKYPGFGEKVRGHILLTDHKDPCWYRNLKIRVLE